MPRHIAPDPYRARSVARFDADACRYERLMSAAMTAAHAMTSAIDNGRVTARGKGLKMERKGASRSYPTRGDESAFTRGARQCRFISSSGIRSEEHTSELQSRENLVCRLLLEKK